MKGKITLLLAIPCLIAILPACKKNGPKEEEKKVDPVAVVQEVTTTLSKTAEISIFTDVLKSIKVSEADIKDGITIFAPTNQAVNNFRKPVNASSGTRPSSLGQTNGSLSVANAISAVADTNTVKLSESVLKDHIVKGILKPEDLVDGKNLVSLSGKSLKVTREGNLIKINGVTLTTVGSDGQHSAYTVSVVLSSTETADADKISVFLPVTIVARQPILETSDPNVPPVLRIDVTTSTIEYLAGTALPKVLTRDNSVLTISYNAAKVPTSAILTQKQGNNMPVRKTNRYEYVANAAGEITRMNIYSYSEDTAGVLIGKHEMTYDEQNRMKTQAKSVVSWDQNYTTTVTYASNGNLSAYSSNNISVSNLAFDNKNGAFKNVKKFYLLSEDIEFPWIWFTIQNNISTVKVPGQVFNIGVVYNSDNYPSKISLSADEDYTFTYRAFSVAK